MSEYVKERKKRKDRSDVERLGWYTVFVSKELVRGHVM